MTYIKKIEISAFGKFKGYCMEFTEGYNEFILENEFGKSTITDFIVFMLYGFTKTAKKISVDAYPLKKYMPWGEEQQISGALELVADGKEYRIERRQRITGSGTVKIRDISGAELGIAESPGLYFFGVDKPTFLRTFAVRQTDMSFFKTDGIETALKNLVTTGNEETSYDAAIKLLQDKKKQYQHAKGKSGRIFALPKEIAELQMEQSANKKLIDDLSENIERFEKINADIELAQKQQKELSALQTKAKANDAARRLEKLNAIDGRIAELKQRADAHREMFTESQLEKLDGLFSSRELAEKQLEKAAAAAESAKAELEKVKADLPEYHFVKSNLAEIENTVNAKSKVNSYLLFAGIASVIIGVSGYFTIPEKIIAVIAASVLSAAGIFLTLFAFIFKTSANVPAHYGMSRKQLCDTYAKYLRLAPQIEIKEALLQKALEEHRSACTEYENCRELCKKSGVDSKQDIAALRAELRNTELLVSRINELAEQKKELLGGESADTLCHNAEGGDSEGISENEVISKIGELTTRKQLLLDQRSALSDSKKKKAELEALLYKSQSKMSELKSELEEALYSNDVLGYAIDALTQAYEKINSVYSPIISQKAEKPLLAFTDGKYNKIYLDKNFELRLKSDFETKELGYFSKGTQEAVYFAVRQAVSELISDKTALPLLLDDPFWALDSARLEKAREFLKKQAENTQVIVFSAR